MQFINLIFTFLVTICLFFSSCTKTEQITQNITQDTVLTGNAPPDYNGTPSVIIENYVNKVYIDLIGEEPDDTELTDNVAYLKVNDLSVKAKDSIVKKVIYTKQYYNRLYDIEKSEMLEGIDSLSIAGQIYLLELQKAIYEDSGKTQLLQLFDDEIRRLTNLQNAPMDYYNGTITLSGFYEVLINNPIYDELNMGSENFVNSCFENLLHRFPTVAELADGIEMVDGNPSALFNEEGNSKGDYIKIITTSTAFYEGMVYDGYQRFLVRDPNSIEVYAESDSVQTSNDIQLLHRIILKKVEYAGF